MLAAATARQLIAQRLATCALVGGRAFEGRYYPATEAELPCWLIAIEAEDIESDGLAYPVLQMHSLRVLAEGFVTSVDAMETQLDTLQLQALQALQATATPFQVRVLGIRRRAGEGEQSDARIGVLSLSLEASFNTVEGDPETLIP